MNYGVSYAIIGCVISLVAFVTTVHSRSSDNQLSSQSQRQTADEQHSMRIVGRQEDILDIHSEELFKVNVPVKNYGADKVRIRAVVNADCGCGAGTSSVHELEPGQTTDVQMMLRTQGETKEGLRAMRLLVRTEDGGVLPVGGDWKYWFKRDVIVDPVALAFGKVQCGQSVSRTISVSILSDTQPREVAVVSTIEALSAKLMNVHPMPNSARGSIYDIMVTGVVPEAQGPMRGAVQIIAKEFKGRNVSFEVPVTLDVASAISIDPEQLFLGYLRSSQSVSKTLRLHSIQGKVVMESVEGPSWLNVAIEAQTPVDDGVLASLKFRPTNTNVKSGSIVLTLQCAVNGKKLPVRIPCVYVIGN